MATARLSASTGGETVHFEVGDSASITLGRGASCDVVIHDQAVSREHCRLAFEEGMLVAKDLGSAHGLVHRGHKVARCELGVGGSFRIGDTEVQVQQIGIGQPAPPAKQPKPAAKPAAETRSPPPPAVAARPAAADGQELVGQELGGYRILSVLGAGGFAVVYRAEQVQLRREVALKVLRQTADGAKDERVAAFLREARAAAALNDPRLVQVYDVGEDQGHYYLSMELVGGGSLARKLRADGPLDWRELLPILRDVAGALQVAHEHGLVHRDVKPANILLTKGGGAKLADLGLAAGGEAFGTVAFMAPEQVRQLPVDGRADLYALGCTAYAALCGKPPFLGTVKEIAQAQVRQAPAPLRGTGLMVSPALEQFVLLELMAKDPAARPASAKDVIEELDRLEADGGGVVRRRSRGRRTRGGGGGGPWLLLVVVLLAAAAAFLLLRDRLPG